VEFTIGPATSGRTRWLNPGYNFVVAGIAGAPSPSRL
jgi:hypothetical protein